MGVFVKGDIVVINFPFSDLTGMKRRPALVLSDLDGDDIILCQITSRIRMDEYAILLDNDDFVMGNLMSESVIRPNKIFTADKNMIQYKACGITNDKFMQVVRTLIDIINVTQ